MLARSVESSHPGTRTLPGMARALWTARSGVPARIRFVSFGASSLDLEIFYYVLTSNYDELLAIQEDIYLRIMDIVEESGTAFAFPSHTAYFARDPGLDEAKRKAAEAQVEAWRQEGSLYLPDFPPETVTVLNGTIEYPQRGSAAVPRFAPGRTYVGDCQRDCQQDA